MVGDGGMNRVLNFCYSTQLSIFYLTKEKIKAPLQRERSLTWQSHLNTLKTLYLNSFKGDCHARI